MKTLFENKNAEIDLCGIAERLKAMRPNCPDPVVLSMHPELYVMVYEHDENSDDWKRRYFSVENGTESESVPDTVRLIFKKMEAAIREGLIKNITPMPKNW